ncbi:MAG: hypothetical protein IJI45_11455 [Anaerolineaceae bacterium]|nr:hypothetical protein [Anaerolineaceae bacterium]
MNIGLVDVDDTNFPNLVLMKLSAWYKRQGDSVALLKPDDVIKGQNLFQPWDKLIGACVFTKNMTLVKRLREQGAEVAGIGTDDKRVLPDEIEHIYPDYSLYGIKDTAYGFLSRGCPRGCPFCIVAGKEGKQSRKVADLSEWWHGQNNIMLCDPNLLACPDRDDLLDQLIDSGAWVDVNQGFDARLLNDSVIEKINMMKIKMLHFAWDNPRDEVVPKMLKKFAERNSLNYRQRRVYVLVNYWSTLNEDLRRVYWLREHGFDPYVMVYEKENAPKQIRRLQRWVNNKLIFRSCERFEDYQSGGRNVENEVVKKHRVLQKGN